MNASVVLSAVTPAVGETVVLAWLVMLTAPAGSTTLTPATAEWALAVVARLAVEDAAKMATSPAVGTALDQLEAVFQSAFVAPVQVWSKPTARVELVTAHSEAQAMREERVRGDKMADREGWWAFIGVFGIEGFA